MAVSLSASKIPSLWSDQQTLCSSSTTKLSSLSSLSARFPAASRRIQSVKQKATFSSARSIPITAKAKNHTDFSFDELLAKSDKPVLVDFYATWCGPCKLMVPILNEVSATLKDKIQVVKIDTEKYPSIAGKYRIAALPTFIIFKDGKPYHRFAGALSANQLMKRIDDSLKIKQ